MSKPLIDRRNFIRGALSAPVVMTVPSQAVASRTTFTACLANGKVMPEPRPLFGATPHDRMLSMLVDEHELWRANKRGEFKQVPGRYIVDADRRTLIRVPQGNALSQKPAVLTDVYAGTPGVKLRPVGKTHVVAAVDDNGRVLTLGTRRTGGSWVYKSCWTSVIAQPKVRTWL